MDNCNVTPVAPQGKYPTPVGGCLSQPRWEGLIRGVDRAWRTRPGMRKDAPVTGSFGSTPLRIESVNVGAYVSGGRAPLRANGGNEKVAGLGLNSAYGRTARSGGGEPLCSNGRPAKADVIWSPWRPPDPSAGIIQYSGRRRPARRRAPVNEGGVVAPAGDNPGNVAGRVVAAGGDGGNAGAGEEPPRDPGGGPIRNVPRVQQRGVCYCCGTDFRLPLMGDLFQRWADDARRAAARQLRAQIGIHPDDREPRPGDRICTNCRIRTAAMNSDNPDNAMLNVVLQRRNLTCMVCEQDRVNTRIPFSARIDAFLSRDIFITEDSRLCPEHLTPDRQAIQAALLAGLDFVRRRVPFHGHDAGRWIQALRDRVRREIPTRFHSIDGFNEQDFRVLTGITKDQFTVLLNTCEPVEVSGTRRNINTEDLVMFLCKLRHGLSDDFLRIMFSVSTRENVSMKISIVRRSLMTYFVPLHLGLRALTRDEYIQRHVTEFANT